MGGNVGDAIAPLVIGAALAVFSWREVVVLNVAPGLVVALLMFTMLGTIRLGAKKTQHADGQSFGQYMAGLRQPLRRRALILLCTGPPFPTMTPTPLRSPLPGSLAHPPGDSP